MSVTRPFRSSLAPIAVSSLLGLMTLAVGCGSGPAPDGWGQHDDHFDIRIGSTGDGGGALVADYDFSREVPVGSPACIGGSGDDCSGGLVLRSAEDPGFAPQEDADPTGSIYPLVAGTRVHLEVTSKSPEASLFIAGTSLAAVGDSVLLGEALEGLHLHGNWQVVLPGGVEPEDDYFFGFKLTSDSSRYSDSQEFIVTLHAGDDDHRHEQD